MNVYEIKTKKSDYPYLIVAGCIRSALAMLRVRGIDDLSDIQSVHCLDKYISSHILTEDVYLYRQGLLQHIAVLQEKLGADNVCVHDALERVSKYIEEESA